MAIIHRITAKAIIVHGGAILLCNQAGEPIWHFGDTQSSEAVKVVDFHHDAGFLVQRSSELLAVAGDTNARVTAVLLDAAADYAV